MLKRIASRQHPLAARFRAAARADDRSIVLLDGAHLVREAVAAGVRIEDAIVDVTRREQPEIAALVASLLDAHVRVTVGTAPVMAAVSPVRSPGAIVALAERPGEAPGRMFPVGRDALIAIACGVQDPGNVGAIVRVAEASGATGMIAAGQSADPFGWKALRGSMGSALRLPIATATDERAMIASVKSHGCRVAAAVPRGGALMYDAPLRGPLAMLVGSEGAGLSDDVVAQADLRVTIPMASAVESLNTAVSAAVLLYEAARQRR